MLGKKTRKAPTTNASQRGDRKTGEFCRRISEAVAAKEVGEKVREPAKEQPTKKSGRVQLYKQSKGAIRKNCLRISSENLSRFGNEIRGDRQEESTQTK